MKESSLKNSQKSGSCRLLSSPKNDGIFGGPPQRPSPVGVMLYFKLMSEPKLVLIIAKECDIIKICT